MQTRWIRALLGFGLVATMVVALISGQSANARPDGSAAPTASGAPLAIVIPALPADQESRPLARISGEVVTTLPTTGVGPSDPDKRVTHWLFVIGGALLGLGHFELARRKLARVKRAGVEPER